jgi:hypothetical protein
MPDAIFVFDRVDSSSSNGLFGCGDVMEHTCQGSVKALFLLRLW